VSGRVYAFPDVGRAGLGNLLFPWARAEAFRKRYSIPMLAPQWVQPRLGTFLRRETDKRIYVRFFVNDEYIGGLRKYLILSRASVVDWNDADAFMASGGAASARGPVVVRFWRYEDWFKGVDHEREYVCHRLWTIVTPRIKRVLADTPTDFEIAVHVRRGDKPTLAYGQTYPTDSPNYAVADEWFIEAIEQARAVLGKDARVKVFSDAKPGQIARILAHRGVSLAPPNPALVDMYMMARGRILIPTSGSSFSAWSQFIGGMPAIWYPTLASRVIRDRADLSLEADLKGHLSPEGLRTLASGAASPARQSGVGA